MAARWSSPAGGMMAALRSLGLTAPLPIIESGLTAPLSSLNIYNTNKEIIHLNT